MSGPFLVALYVFKYTLKILVFYYLFKKKKGNKNGKNGDDKTAETTIAQKQTT